MSPFLDALLPSSWAGCDLPGQSVLALGHGDGHKAPQGQRLVEGKGSAGHAALQKAQQHQPCRAAAAFSTRHTAR